MTNPFVTVIVSSYNRPTLIRDALDSILAQTWPNIQVIIADDFSDERMDEVLDKYGKHFDLVYPSREPSLHERQYGQRCSVCINAAMPYATGDFVCFLPDDDFLTPRSIEVRAQYLIDHPDVNAVYGRLEACKSEVPHAGLHWLPAHVPDCLIVASGCGNANFKAERSVSEGLWASSQKDKVRCWHDRYGFWSAEPIVRAANKLDHSMPMCRRWWCDFWGEPHTLPIWPEQASVEVVCGDGHSEESITTRRLAGNERIGERFDCPDAGFFFRCELAGLGPFHSVDEVVVVKRYHALHHRTDPSRRE